MTDKPIPPINEFDMSFWSKEWTPEQQELREFEGKLMGTFLDTKEVANKIYVRGKTSPAEAWEMAEKWIKFLELERQLVLKKIAEKKLELGLENTTEESSDND